MGERVEADVCVVGAGYAGLAAARRLTQHGKTVAVLEARDRVGGRIWTWHLDDGTAIDRGGGWLGPAHEAMFGLARDFGIQTYKTNVKGKHVLQHGDRMRTYTGLIPKISPLAIASIVRAQLKVDRMAKRLPIDAPWDAPNAAEWDAERVSDFVRSLKVRQGAANDLFSMAVRGLMTADLDEVSLLHLLTLVRGHGSINSLFSIEKGAQENLVDGGAGAMAARMADELGDALHLRAPVRSVTHTGDGVTVTSDDVTVEARHAVVAIPPALIPEIAWDPALPEDRATLYRNDKGGPETKTLIVYDEPFWRADGFSGQTSEPESAAETTLDSSPMSGSPGVLASFTFGPSAVRMDALAAEQRREATLDALATRLGPKARRPSAYVETSWIGEEWTRGCSMGHLPPNILSRHGHLLREPMGRVHWAGTETATISHGAMDGAVRSGYRAADEVLALS